MSFFLTNTTELILETLVFPAGTRLQWTALLLNKDEVPLRGFPETDKSEKNKKM